MATSLMPEWPATGAAPPRSRPAGTRDDGPVLTLFGAIGIWVAIETALVGLAVHLIA